MWEWEEYLPKAREENVEREMMSKSSIHWSARVAKRERAKKRVGEETRNLFM